jgi:hypothetical protein
MWIWRVQNFDLVAVPQKQYGQFYQGKKENIVYFLQVG